MSRELVLCTLALCVAGFLTISCGQLAFPRSPARANRSASDAETTAWRHLWAPLLPAMCAVAILVGWTAQEPRTSDELLTPLAFAFAAPMLMTVLRAALRAWFALRSSSRDLPAVTGGLFHPRVFVAPRLRGILSRESLTAVYAHERAHARHYDPLRIWLGQLATDLQWPSRRAQCRFQDWLAALELARDEEARRNGASGEDLAVAILAATRLEVRGGANAAAALTQPARNLTRRIGRLLDPLPPDPGRSHRLHRIGFLLIGLFLVAACVLGVRFGDMLVRALPIVTT
ncbi:MAG: hypothetical protein ND807_07900 [Vicinamibacterales bacterium]|nr:hypothetical protein [Vicinamibacterales bacterium]